MKMVQDFNPEWIVAAKACTPCRLFAFRLSAATVSIKNLEHQQHGQTSSARDSELV
jgi:hypothetical protein